MPSSGMLRRVALVRTDVSVELSASSIRVTTIGELGTALAVTINRRRLRRNSHPDDGGAKFLRNVSSYKSHTRRNIPEDAILHAFNLLGPNTAYFTILYVSGPFPESVWIISQIPQRPLTVRPFQFACHYKSCHSTLKYTICYNC
jgi:hypothetical protein